MAHISDYVSWRGDLKFSERGFGIEDNLILAELVYIDFKPVLREGETMSLRDAVSLLDAKGLLKNTRAGSGKDDLDFALSCAKSERFGKIRLTDFTDVYDSSDRQFAAVTYILDDDTNVIAYRGTDSTIIGWKEDFMISYTHVVSQELALEYAKKHVKIDGGSYVILGHSKGAHLALYAAAHLDDNEKEILNHVYINDGPGFCEEVLDKKLIDSIKDKTTKITPEYSIIGRIFEPVVGENLIVKSSAVAIMQHSMQSWLLESVGLVTCSDHAPESHLITDMIEKFVEGMDLRARENFVESLFESMAATGAGTIKEFASQGPAAFEALLMNMHENDALSIKKKARKIKKKDNENSRILLRIWGFINRKESIRIAITLLLSILCFAFPDFAMESVVFTFIIAICIYEVFLTGQYLKESEWDFKKERPRVLLCIVLWFITSAILIKDGALFVISSMLIGVLLLALAYQNVINFKIYNDKMFERFRYSFEGIVTLLLGGYILITPDIENKWYMLSCGTLLLIDAIFEFLKLLRDRVAYK